MDKKFQMLLGVAAVGTAAYLLWKQSQKPKSFANLMSLPIDEGGYKPQCKGRNDRMGSFEYDGKTMYWCCQPGFFTDNRPDKKCSELTSIVEG